MLQCLVVAFRPLRVEELAELLAFEFDSAPGGIPKYCAAWRLDDQTQAVLSTCSSLVTIVNDDWYGRQVQFSHFSVKEFLMSNRLGFSRYHIRPVSAHTILTQACLGVLLHSDGRAKARSVNDLPLAKYAARHWVEHAQFEDVASHVKDGMEILFDSEKPHFAAWIKLHDIDRTTRYKRDSSTSKRPRHPSRNPLYYSVLCGFYDLVKHLAIKHPQHVQEHVTAIYARYDSPLLAAVSENYLEVAELLLEHGAAIDCRETTGKTILLEVLSRSRRNLVSIVKFLLSHGADPNARDKILRCSLHLLAAKGGDLEVAQMLLKHNADVRSQDNNGKTPLHVLSEGRDRDKTEYLEHVRLFLEHGANVNIRDKNGRTPLQLAVRCDRYHLARILLEHGTDANAADNEGMTTLHVLSEVRDDDKGNVLNLALLLLKHGTKVNTRDKDNETPLHLAVKRVRFKLAVTLLENGADANVEDNDGRTTLHILSESRNNDEGDVLNFALLLLKHGAMANTRDKGNQTPLHLAMKRDRSKLAVTLLEHGADDDAKDNNGRATLHILLSDRWNMDEDDVLNLALLLLKHGAEVNTQDKDNQTPLHRVMKHHRPKLAAILLEHGADPNAEDNNGRTTLHILLSESLNIDKGNLTDLVLLLLKHGAKVNTRNLDNQTPLHLAARRGWFKFAGILLEYGADAKVENLLHYDGKTMLHILSEIRINNECDLLNLALLLLKYGADVNTLDKHNQTPLHLAVKRDRSELAVILLEHGADASAEDNNRRTMLHILLSETWNMDEGDVLNLALMLMKQGAEVNTRDKDNETPLHLAARRGWFKLAGILLECEADAKAENYDGKTTLHILSEIRINNESDALNLALLLLRSGAEANARDMDNQTPLHLAVRRNRPRLAAILLEHGADPNAEDNDGKTPLHKLLQYQIYDTSGVGIVLKHKMSRSEHGAEVSKQYKENETQADTSLENKTGETPVHQASRGQYSSRDRSASGTQLLPERGVGINVQGNHVTPSHLQSDFGPVEVAQALLDRGANVNASNDGSESSLYQGLEGGYHIHCDNPGITSGV